MPDLTELLARGGLALLLGVLVGLERQARLERGSRFERDPGESQDGSETEPAVPDHEQLAGVRTHAVLALVGMIAGVWPSTWAFPATLLGVSAMLVAGYLKSVESEGDLGQTSDFAALAVFLIGGLCGLGETVFAASAAAALALLLSAKNRLHQFAGRLRGRDIHAVVKFAAVSVIVLPLLPEEPVFLAQHIEDPRYAEAWWATLDLDLRQVWWMVIFVSSISFVGYFLSMFIGSRRGLLWTGAVGGLASSTAVSLAHARESRKTPDLVPELAIGILLANLIMPVRVVALVLFAAPVLTGLVALPALLSTLIPAVVVAVLYRKRSQDELGETHLANPFSLGPALKFGLLFACVLICAQIAERWFGQSGLYVLAFVAGLTDADAITLTGGELYAKEQIPALTAVTVVGLAIAGNTVFKASCVLVLGSPALRRMVGLAFAGMLMGCLGGLAIARVLG